MLMSYTEDMNPTSLHPEVTTCTRDDAQLITTVQGIQVNATDSQANAKSLGANDDITCDHQISNVPLGDATHSPTSVTDQ